jgi:hypothetical protein
MPGFTPIPPVTFNRSQTPAVDRLWAEIEVRFDIYLNNAGSLVSIDPSFILRTHQWPLMPA